MISDYFNSKVIWKQSNGVNIYNEPTYAENEIEVYKEEKIRLTKNTNGIEVTSTATLYVTDKPNYDDMLDGRPILTINSLNSLDGVYGYEVLIWA